MGKIAGLIMIAGGVGTAAYLYPMLTASDNKAERQMSEVVRISTSAIPVAPSTEPKATRPPVQLTVRPSTSPGAEPFPQRVVSAETSPGKPPLLAAPLPQPRPVAVVPDPQPIARPIEPPQPQLAKRPARTEDEGRLTLTRDIQTELKRVGCFEGQVDGAWSTETRQAMKTFIDRVNATLPISEPDHILKTLVQGHPGNACGRSCPAGQAIAGDGKCLPTAIIAQTTKRAPVQREAPAAQAQAAPGTAASGWSTRVTAAVPPSPAPAPVVVARDARPESRPEPPAGRMAIGASTVPPPLPAVAAAPPLPTKRGAIVLKPREVAARVATDPNATQPENTARPPIGAIAAIDPNAPAPNPAAVVAEENDPRPRAVAPPPVFRAPPPRFANSYTPPPVYRERQKFGPQIFRQMEANGR